MARKRLRPLYLILIAGMLVVALVVSAIEIHRQARMLDTFEPVRAEVADGHVERRTSGGSRSRTTRYHPVIRYRYEVEGAIHTSTRVTPLPKGGSESWARSILEEHPEGARVTAFVDPDDPADSYLVVRSSFRPYAGLLASLFGLPTTLLALAFLFRGTRHVDRRFDLAGFVVAAIAGSAYLVHFANRTASHATWIAPVAAVVFAGLLVAAPLLLRRKMRGSPAAAPAPEESPGSLHAPPG